MSKTKTRRSPKHRATVVAKNSRVVPSGANLVISWLYVLGALAFIYCIVFESVWVILLLSALGAVFAFFIAVIVVLMVDSVKMIMRKGKYTR